MKSSGLVILFIILFNSEALPHGNNADLVIGKKDSIFSKVLNEWCPYEIYFPPGYEKKENKFPLMIVLDGYFLWSAAIADYLNFSGNIPPMVIVAVGNTDRDRDFTPTNSKNIEGEEIPTSGGANNFLNFFETELIPSLDAKYRLEKFRILVGHSLGGLFVSYSMIERPDLFQAYVAMSPTLPWDNNFLIKEASSKIKRKYSRNLFYYLGMDNQKGVMLNSAQKMIKLIKHKKSENLECKFTIYKNEDHISCFFIGLYDALRYIYKPFKISERLIESGDAVGMEKHYKYLSERYNYKIIPSWEWLDWIANWHHLMKRNEKAISIYELALRYYPLFISSHIKIASIHEKAHHFDKAIKCLETALAQTKNSEEIRIIKSKITELKNK